MTIVEKNTNNYNFVWPNCFDKNINKGDKDSLGAFFNNKICKTPFLYNFHGIATWWSFVVCKCLCIICMHVMLSGKYVIFVPIIWAHGI